MAGSSVSRTVLSSRSGYKNTSDGCRFPGLDWASNRSGLGGKTRTSTWASCPTSYHMPPSCHRKHSSLPSPFYPSHIFRVLAIKYYHKRVNGLHTWALSISEMTITASHCQMESTFSKWAGLGLNVWWTQWSYCISVLEGFTSSQFLPSSPISSTCEFLSRSLSTSFSFSSFSPYLLLLLIAFLFCLTGTALALRRPGTWEDPGSMPTFLPKHSLLLGIHWDAQLSVFLIFLPVL